MAVISAGLFGKLPGKSPRGSTLSDGVLDV
jgi:hypothetical protein